MVKRPGIDLPGEQAGLMPSAQWLMKTYHHRWYPDETLDVAIGQGAVEATPIQLARIIGGIASGGHLVRPHSVFPDELPDDFRRALQDTYPGSGKVDIPIDPENWEIITNGMYQVTQPGLYHTASAERLPGIDFGGKTGTAQVMSHAGFRQDRQRTEYESQRVVRRRNPAPQSRTGGRRAFPERRQELVCSPGIGARVVSAYVEKQRRLANNLQPQKAATPAKPAEVGAVWTTPDPANPGSQTARIHAGTFFVNPGKDPTPRSLRSPSRRHPGSTPPLPPAGSDQP